MSNILNGCVRDFPTIGRARIVIVHTLIEDANGMRAAYAAAFTSAQYDEHGRDGLIQWTKDHGKKCGFAEAQQIFPDLKESQYRH